jgi:hypothetical protein
MPDKSSGLDHVADGATYFIEYEFPIKKRDIKPFSPMG